MYHLAAENVPCLATAIMWHSGYLQRKNGAVIGTGIRPGRRPLSLPEPTQPVRLYLSEHTERHFEDLNFRILWRCLPVFYPNSKVRDYRR